jgi:molybdopterin converting factor small subunit
LPLKIVSIKFFGMQRTITKTDSIDMPITEKTRVTDALEYVRQRYPELPLDQETLLITVNHEQASPDTMLKPNDTVSFLPAIGGG